MQNNVECALVGYSGHGLVVAESALLSGVNLVGYTSPEKSLINPFFLNYLGFEKDENFKGWNGSTKYILGLGDNQLRKKAATFIQSKKAEFLNIIHPDSSISSVFKLGIGNFISRNVSINALVSLGDFCILNTGAIIEHECSIANFVHIAPGAVLAGNVSVGECSFIGANAVIKQGVTIGDNVVIGAGAVIIKNIGDNQKVVGNPGKII